MLYTLLLWIIVGLVWCLWCCLDGESPWRALVAVVAWPWSMFCAFAPRRKQRG
jgi:hypothetical protein